MAIEILTAEQLAAHQSRGGAHEQYMPALAKMKPGTGGRIVVSKEGASRQTIKNRLLAAAQQLEMPISFLRADPDTVMFQVVDMSQAPKKRGRPRKAKPAA